MTQKKKGLITLRINSVPAYDMLKQMYDHNMYVGGFGLLDVSQSCNVNLRDTLEQSSSNARAKVVTMGTRSDYRYSYNTVRALTRNRNGIL